MGDIKFDRFLKLYCIVELLSIIILICFKSVFEVLVLVAVNFHIITIFILIVIEEPIIKQLP